MEAPEQRPNPVTEFDVICYESSNEIVEFLVDKLILKVAFSTFNEASMDS
jgi:hypothetical protein